MLLLFDLLCACADFNEFVKNVACTMARLEQLNPGEPYSTHLAMMLLDAVCIYYGHYSAEALASESNP